MLAILTGRNVERRRQDLGHDVKTRSAKNRSPCLYGCRMGAGLSVVEITSNTSSVGFQTSHLGHGASCRRNVAGSSNTGAGTSSSCGPIDFLVKSTTVYRFFSSPPVARIHCASSSTGGASLSARACAALLFRLLLHRGKYRTPAPKVADTMPPSAMTTWAPGLSMPTRSPSWTWEAPDVAAGGEPRPSTPCGAAVILASGGMLAPRAVLVLALGFFVVAAAAIGSVVDRPALYVKQAALANDEKDAKSDELQWVSRQGPARSATAACAGPPHWQPRSAEPQPVTPNAPLRHGVCPYR